MSNKQYDFWKAFNMRYFPAIITFYGVVGETLNIPYTSETLIIATAFNTMIGAFLGISTKKYRINSVELEEEQLEEFHDNKGDE